MHLPGRLKATTVGDLLGTLHRACATGTLELSEDSGRTHRLHLAEGRVTSVELDGASSPLLTILRRSGHVDEGTQRRSILRAMSSRRMVGEVLVADFQLSPAVVGAAVRKQLLERLALLERLVDARISFRVTVRPPPSALREEPLNPGEFLRGRRRARDRGTPTPTASKPEAAPWRELGVPRDATPEELKRAYRKLARDLHPDLHPHASPEERAELSRRFSAVTTAYNELRSRVA